MKLIAGRKQKPVSVRIPPDLQAEIEEAAARNARSRNGEIIFRLAASFGPQDARRPQKGERQ